MYLRLKTYHYCQFITLLYGEHGINITTLRSSLLFNPSLVLCQPRYAQYQPYTISHSTSNVLHVVYSHVELRGLHNTYEPWGLLQMYVCILILNGNHHWWMAIIQAMNYTVHADIHQYSTGILTKNQVLMKALKARKE